jgi:hypothetical protein
MNKRRMQKTGCSMLVAALVGLLPIVAAHADDNSPSFGQEPETGTMGPVRQDADEALPQGPEDRGAQGPLRDDADAAQPNELMPQGPVIDQSTGAQGPIRQDSQMEPQYRQPDYAAGAPGPMRSDTNCRQYFGDSNQFMDPGGVKTVPCEYGALGPIRQDPYPYSYYGTQPNYAVQGPLRDDPSSREFMRYHGDSNFFLDKGDVRGNAPSATDNWRPR